jgi:hypothetical protein
MVSESNGCGMRKQRSWCKRATVMLLESNGRGVREQGSWCKKATVVE